MSTFCKYGRTPAVLLVHGPTGESAMCTSQPTLTKSREMAMKILRSRLWARQNGQIRPSPDNVIETGELEDFSDAIISTDQ